MSHPDTGTWRAWLDDEALVPDAERHLSACADCTRELTRVRADASYATTAVALLDPPAAAIRPAAGSRTNALEHKRKRRFGHGRQWATSAAAALVAVALVGTPMGRATAADFLSLFRSERVALISVDEPTMEDTAAALGQLGEVGDVDDREPVQVASLAAAAERTGLALTVPDPTTLPDGMDGKPVVRVTDDQQLRFTFREAATRAYLEQFDAADRRLPDGYDGATLVVNIPAGVLQEYGGGDGDSAVFVGHAGMVTAAVDGDIDLDTLRTFLLDLPGLPESVVQQLALIDDWRTTLPIPIPIGRIGGEETTVDGAEAILVEQPGLGSGLLWQRNGVVTGVAGSMDEEALRSLVDNLRAP